MNKEQINSILNNVDITKLKTYTYNVNNKEYIVSEIDYDDFTRNVSESLEDFIKRTMPKDNDELSYLIGLYIEKTLRNK